MGKDSKEIPEQFALDEISMFKNRIKRDIGNGVASGLHVLDAAEAANVNRNLVLANIGCDEDFREWWALSKGRPRLCTSMTSDKMPVFDAGEDLLRGLIAMGLPEKALELAATLDIETAEGKSDFKWLMKEVFVKLTPERKEIKTQKVPFDQLTDAELLAKQALISKRMAEVLEQQAAATDAVDSYAEEDARRAEEQG